MYVCMYVCFIEAHQFLVYFDTVYTPMKSLKESWIEWYIENS